MRGMVKRKLIVDIVRAQNVAEACLQKYNGNKYAYLAGAYEAVFAELLGFSDLKEFDKLIEEAKRHV